VVVAAVRGSAPREAGACMLVGEGSVVGTIGGGHLEWKSIGIARQMFASGAAGEVQFDRLSLGATLGQCCGGSVALEFRRVDARDAPDLHTQLAPATTPLALFGGGHVGTALVNVLAPLPFAVRWIDSRDEIFPEDTPPQVVCEHSSPVHRAVDELAPGSRVLVMSFSHAEDLDVVIACLQRLRARDDLPFVGLIGSHTKWATFRHRLEARGFGEAEIARITCPIGVPGIAGKEPEVIAVAVAAQLLQTL
jgi:xanthine dehydrogenase accessory factor